MPGKSEKMTGVGMLIRAGAKGVSVGLSGVNTGVSVLEGVHPDIANKMIIGNIIHLVKCQTLFFSFTTLHS